MLANRNANTILGANSIGQGSMIAGDGNATATLRARLVKFTRGLFLRLGDWRALDLKRTYATTALRPAMCTAICPSRRHQRHQRWSPSVVVAPGAVGVR